MAGLLDPIMTIRSIHELVVKWESGTRLLYSKKCKHEVITAALKLSALTVSWENICVFAGSLHVHRREDVVGKGQPSVDEFLLFIIKRVAVVYVKLTLCKPLSEKKRFLNPFVSCSIH